MGREFRQSAKAINFDESSGTPGFLGNPTPTRPTSADRINAGHPAEHPNHRIRDGITSPARTLAIANGRPRPVGVGVNSQQFDPDGQAAQGVRKVQEIIEYGMVVNPLTIGPDAMAVGMRWR